MRQASPTHFLFMLFALCCSLVLPAQTWAQDSNPDYRLSPGDQIRVQVFQNAELTVETRISESGVIRYPLIGSIQLAGLSLASAETKIADALREGGYLVRPQVNIALLQARGSQVVVLGQVNRPGRFALETPGMRVTDMLAIAGGSSSSGDDLAVLTGTRAGKPFRKMIDVAGLFLPNASIEDNVVLEAGDTIYVHRAPMFYIYGEAQRSGAHRIERGMTVMQGLATGGGPTARGTESRLRLYRRNAAGAVEQVSPDMADLLQPGDVIYVRESLF